VAWAADSRLSKEKSPTSCTYTFRKVNTAAHNNLTYASPNNILTMTNNQYFWVKQRLEYLVALCGKKRDQM
jgi:hypothetical protein